MKDYFHKQVFLHQNEFRHAASLEVLLWDGSFKLCRAQIPQVLDNNLFEFLLDGFLPDCQYLTSLDPKLISKNP
jgi:hypothetical protein